MSQMTYIQAISDALRYEMRRDSSVFLIGEDIAGSFGGAFKVTKGFEEEFGAQRVINAPISEAAIVGAAIGASLNGMRPVVEMQFMDFITNAFNQLVNVAATTAYRWGIGVPIVVRGPSGGGVGGGPFHSRNSEAWFAHTPGIKVVCPATASDAKGLLISSIRDNNPVVFFEHKGLYRKVKDDVPDGEYSVPLGQAALVRPGRDASIIAYGSMVHEAIAVAEELAKEGVEVEIVDIRTLVPFDEQTVLSSVKRTHRVLIAHEATLTGGFGGEIAARIADAAFEYLDAPVKRLAAFDAPTPFAPTLEQEVLPNKAKMLAAIRELLAY
ncbi:MAG: alpha-ketoacid dehydrogenase subunit beta [Bacteroidota bacterium]|nr:alpha-ketoacid dehydrogenase subunit beta [Candidatus Kapabacteria bacterium]MDW8219784.1 alpha-ketoacid dehydrogenase subunit beta [Bacteroidota bacterium]